MAFTNHAVDHLIRSVLDSKITSKIVRLGGHSADELIASKSLENLEKIAGESRLRPALNIQFRILKNLESDMMELMNRVTGRWVPSRKVMDALEYDSPDQFESLSHPPAWIIHHYATCATNEGWEVAGGEDRSIKTLFDYWYRGLDIDFLLPDAPPPVHDKEVSASEPNRYRILQRVPSPEEAAGGEGRNEDSDDPEPDLSDIPLTERWMFVPKKKSPLFAPEPESPDDDAQAPPSPVPSMSPRDAFLASFGALDAQVPTGDRGLDELEAVSDIWTTSKKERGILGATWIRKARTRDYEIQRTEFERVEKSHKKAQERYSELKDEASWPFSLRTRHRLIIFA